MKAELTGQDVEEVHVVSYRTHARAELGRAPSSSPAAESFGPSLDESVDGPALAVVRDASRRSRTAGTGQTTSPCTKNTSPVNGQSAVAR